MQRGLWPAPKGLNRRLQIREFVTGFDRQQCRTKRRPRPAAPAQLRLPREHPKVPNRRVLPKGSTDGRRSPGGGAAGSARLGGSGVPEGGVSPRPRSRPLDGGSGSIVISFVCVLPPGSGGGKRDAVALEECEKRGEKKAAWERSASRQLPAAAALFYYVI